jgi:hypothetical protein
MKMRFPAILFALAIGLSLGFAQGQTTKPKDDDLDSLLKEVERKESAGSKPPKPAADKPDSKPVAPSDKPKTMGEVTGRDKELDDLLGKIGESKDEPAPEEKKPPMPGGEGDDGSPMPGGEGDDSKPMPREKPDGLSGEQKKLDEHLEEISGKKPRQKGGKDGKGEQGAGEDQGPLGDLVKQMREVEERLGKPDTGEETRKRQSEIVKKMDGLIEQMKQAKNQQQAMRMLRQGQKPGSNMPQQPNGDLAQGPPATKPAKPDDKSILALDKNAWGHLPPDLRAEMENVFKEDLLPSRADLIKRYYLSVSKKSLTREE